MDDVVCNAGCRAETCRKRLSVTVPGACPGKAAVAAGHDGLDSCCWVRTATATV